MIDWFGQKNDDDNEFKEFPENEIIPRDFNVKISSFYCFYSHRERERGREKMEFICHYFSIEQNIS